MDFIFHQAQSTELMDPCSKTQELFIEKHCCRLYLSSSILPILWESLLWRKDLLNADLVTSSETTSK